MELSAARPCRNGLPAMQKDRRERKSPHRARRKSLRIFDRDKMHAPIVQNGTDIRVPKKIKASFRIH
jgi:hypothetical protein